MGDPGAPIRSLTRRQAQPDLERPGRGVATWLLLAVHVVLTGIAVWLIPLLSMGSAACDQQCDFAAADAAILGARVTVLAVLGLTIATLGPRWKKWASSWPIVLIGLVVTIVAVIATYHVLVAALPAP